MNFLLIFFTTAILYADNSENYKLSVKLYDNSQMTEEVTKKFSYSVLEIQQSNLVKTNKKLHDIWDKCSKAK